MKKIYILGITGMLGSELFLNFNNNNNYKVRGSIRSKSSSFFKNFKNIDYNTSASNFKKIQSNLIKFKPHYILNCLGYIKQNINKKTPLKDIFYLNSKFPFELESISKKINAKLVLFSTDCVFDGNSGNYKEASHLNAKDIYGISKILGEIKTNKNVLTIRTSIIGHEINRNKGLLEWFLSLKKKKCEGFSRVYFSGVTTFEVYKFLDKYVFKKKKFYNGVIHLSSYKISKYHLLNIISKIYKKKIVIKKTNTFSSNRTLNNNLIKNNLNFKPKKWKKMIEEMNENFFLFRK